MTAVRFEHVSKSFPGVQALNDVPLEIAEGSCHALCGENGAGKSTLGKILAGIYPMDEGRLTVHGNDVRFNSPRDALAVGVGMVHQELSFCENLSVAENLCLGRIPSRRGVCVATRHGRAGARYARRHRRRSVGGRPPARW
jgi:ABC-type sugar transport system ATPase subunit